MVSSQNKFPLGMKLLVAWTVWSAISLAMGVLKVPVVQFGAFIGVGVTAWLWAAIVASLLIVAAYGITKRSERARKFLMYWFVGATVLALGNLYFFIINESLYDAAYKQYLSSDVYLLMSREAIRSSLIFGTVFSTLVAAVQFVYLLRKKSFFIK